VHVVATAGHVDHGKSTLVRALTGTDPDRLAEERRRGLTIELGFAWTRLAEGQDLAFVDVPGHQRFLATMLAGVGPVPAVLLVVAADEGWRRQSGEHLAALAALGVQHGLVVVTRTDLADPGPAAAQAAEQLAGTPLAGSPWRGVSARTGAGLPELRAALGVLVAGLPAPDPAARVRLWVDRVFTVAGTGTVVTGTLAAGTLRVGDVLSLADSDGVEREVRVRGLQSLAVPREEVPAVARVAVALRGVPRDGLRRGDVLLTPGRWGSTDALDVRLTVDPADLPASLVLHVGAAAVPARLRPLGDDLARVTLSRRLPLEPGDRALLRDPGRQSVAAGVVVLDAAPPTLARRGAARARAVALRGRPAGAVIDVVAEVARRGVVSRAALAAAGVLAVDAAAPAAVVPVGPLLVDRARWDSWRAAVPGLLSAYAAEHPSTTGTPRAALPALLGLPDAALLDALLASVGDVRDAGAGRVALGAAAPALPAAVSAALAALGERWARAPYAAPEADDLVRLGLTPRLLGALAARGHLLRLPGDVVLPPGAAAAAVGVLAGLPQPFTVSAAREALGTSRRVVVPLLEQLDRERLTRRLDDTGRVVVARR